MYSDKNMDQGENNVIKFCVNKTVFSSFLPFTHIENFQRAGVGVYSVTPSGIPT